MQIKTDIFESHKIYLNQRKSYQIFLFLKNIFKILINILVKLIKSKIK